MGDRATLLPYRLRTVRVGVQITLPTLVLLALYPLVGHSVDTSLGWYYLVISGALLGVALVAALPWERLLRTRYGIPAMYTWSVADIVLVSAAIALSAVPGRRCGACTS